MPAAALTPEDRWAEHARFAAETAKTVGGAIAIGNVGIVTRKKGRANFATAADHAAQEAILSAIAAHDPGAAILAEESSTRAPAGAERVWVVDPIDGTLNFSRALPFYCVAIGYVEDGVARAGAVYAPRLQELFVATKGRGATLNGIAIRVSDTRTAAEAFAVSSLAFGSASKKGSRFVALNATCARLRIIGSAALEICYVAAGRVDLFVHEFLSPWDIAGPQLIAREAGATVLSLSTGANAAWDERAVVVGNSAVVRDALAKMPLVRPKRR